MSKPLFDQIEAALLARLPQPPRVGKYIPLDWSGAAGMAATLREEHEQGKHADGVAMDDDQVCPLCPSPDPERILRLLSAFRRWRARNHK